MLGFQPHPPACDPSKTFQDWGSRVPAMPLGAQTEMSPGDDPLGLHNRSSILGEGGRQRPRYGQGGPITDKWGK